MHVSCSLITEAPIGLIKNANTNRVLHGVVVMAHSATHEHDRGHEASQVQALDPHTPSVTHGFKARHGSGPLAMFV